MSRNITLYLDDILISIGKIERYTANLTQASFAADEVNLEVCRSRFRLERGAEKSPSIESCGNWPLTASFYVFGVESTYV